MTANYKNYNYSLNPVNMNFPNHIKYKKTINQLWLRFLSKTFYCIPNNKKLYYFCQIIKFLKDNIKTIDEESLLILFHTINIKKNKKILHLAISFIDSILQFLTIYPRTSLHARINICLRGTTAQNVHTTCHQ